MALQPFYGQAMELIAVEGETSLVATLKDIMPAIEQFKKDNKEAPKDRFAGMSEEVRRMWI